MAVPNRTSLSQFWLPSLLFVLSVVSILFTLRNDDIPVIGTNVKERSVLDESDLDAYRSMINRAMQGSASWRSWCEKPEEALPTVRFANFDQNQDNSRWISLRRYLPQREQDAVLRCQNADRRTDDLMHVCLFLTPKDLGNQVATSSGLHLVEVTMELRAMGRKKAYSCAEAVAAGEQPIELAVWYTYYSTPQTIKKPLRFERITGGTRIFPTIAQNAERSTASSRP